MFEVISIHDHMRWEKILHLFQVSDIYYTSQYFLSAMKLDPGEALMFYYIDEEGEIAYPFIKRAIEGNSSAYYDITTAFGYGGPLVKAAKNMPQLIHNFLRVFSDYCRQENIIVEYIRFHPLKGNAELFKEHLNLMPVYETFTLKLDPHSKPASAQSKEQWENGFVIKKLGTVRHMFEFLVLYYSGVRRKEDADSYYFFTNDYFEALISSLGPNLHLFGAYHENKLISASYVLTLGDTIYHHLEGNGEEPEAEDAAKLLLMKIAEWGRDNYYQFFHLGGDYFEDGEEGSGVKEQISNMPASVFYICKKVHDASIYKQLISEEESDVIKRYRNI